MKTLTKIHPYLLLSVYDDLRKDIKRLMLEAYEIGKNDAWTSQIQEKIEKETGDKK